MGGNSGGLSEGTRTSSWTVIPPNTGIMMIMGGINLDVGGLLTPRLPVFAGGVLKISKPAGATDLNTDICTFVRR